MKKVVFEAASFEAVSTAFDCFANDHVIVDVIDVTSIRNVRGVEPFTVFQRIVFYLGKKVRYA